MENLSKELSEVKHSREYKSFIIEIDNMNEMKTHYAKPMLVRRHFWLIKFSRADESDGASLKIDFFLKNDQHETYMTGSLLLNYW